MSKSKGGRPKNTGHDVRSLSEYRHAIQEAELNERQARRWQVIANIPEIQYNDFIATKLENGEIELTSGAVYKYGLALKRESEQGGQGNATNDPPCQSIEIPPDITYTRVPHYLIRQQHKLNEEAFRVALAVADRTAGYNKKEDIISLSQFQRLTGLSYRKARKGIKEAVEAGAIIQQEYDAESHIYSLPAYPAADTQKKIIKEKKTKEIPANAGATAKHPAIQAYRSAAHRFPPKSWYSKIAEAVGDDPARVDVFKAHVHEWVGRGYNASNAKGILESFEKGGLAARGSMPSTIPPGKHKSQRADVRSLTQEQREQARLAMKGEQ